MKRFSSFSPRIKLISIFGILIFAGVGVYYVWLSSAYPACANPRVSAQIIELYVCDNMIITTYHRDAKDPGYFKNPPNGAIDIYTNLPRNQANANPSKGGDWEYMLVAYSTASQNDTGTKPQIKRLECIWKQCFSTWSFTGGLGVCMKFRESEFNNQRIHLARLYIDNDQDNSPANRDPAQRPNNLEVKLGAYNDVYPERFGGAFTRMCNPSSSQTRTVLDLITHPTWFSSGIISRIGLSHVAGGNEGGDPENGNNNAGGTGGSNSGTGNEGTGQGPGSGSGSGGGGSSANQQGDNPNSVPSSSSQGDNDNTKLDPSPFFDGKEYARASDPDTLAGTITNTSKKIIRTWPIVLGITILGGIAGFGYWKWRRKVSQ